MKHREGRFKEYVTLGAVTISLIVALPLLAVGLFVLRLGIVAAALAAIVVGAILLIVSRRFRQKLRAAVEPSYDYKGLHLSTGVGLDRSHSWANVEPDGAFVGVDDLAASCLGPVARVELPAPGRHVNRGEFLFVLARNGRKLEVSSPVTGTVIASNDALLSDPGRVNRDPFGLGWVTRIRTDDPRASRRLLLRGFKAQEWFRNEVDQLTAELGRSPAALPSLPDGGTVVDELYRAIDAPTWHWLQVNFFGGDENAK